MDKVFTNRVKSIWQFMKLRCYEPSHHAYKSYGAIGVTMCDEWLDFEKFLDWYEENYYKVVGAKMVVDKDIMGGAHYSPENCIIIPEKINNCLIHKPNGKLRGLQRFGDKYQVKVKDSITGVNLYVGTFDTVDRASEEYRKAKNTVFQSVVDLYESEMPPHITEILREYTV